MSTPGLGSFVQPTLHVPPPIQAGIDSGQFFRDGGVVRRVVGGRIVKHLKEVPGPEKVVEEAAKRAAKIVPKFVVPIVLATATVGAAAAYVITKRKDARRLDALTEAKADIPPCVTDFEASLRGYVDAGGDGVLDAAIVDRVIADLDKVKAWVDGGNTVEFSFEQLEPLFGLVIGHTSALARAHSVDVTDFEHQEADRDGWAVVHLRQHLKVQKRILGETA